MRCVERSMRPSKPMGSVRDVVRIMLPLRSARCCAPRGDRVEKPIKLLNPRFGRLRTSKLRPVQSPGLGGGEPEHEVRWEALGVALDLLVESLGGYAVESGELC